jgi:hypothetical protein
MRFLLTFVVAIALSGCATQFTVPDTLGDPKNANNYGYHPLDPLPVKLTVDKSKVLEEMPDETIRIAIGTVSGDGGITYGTAKIGAEGKNYVVVLDYIKFGTDSFGVALSSPDNKGNKVATLVEASQANAVVPVYIGVGLRLTANVFVKKGSVNLGSLFALGVAAKAEQVSGTLVIQTLGVSGPEISGLIPMPGEISESTIQNAILALASIKAKMYDTKTSITPRVVGVYNNLGGGEATINGFISSLLEKQIPFPRPTK